MMRATYTEIVNLTGSELPQTVLEEIINQADREIDAFLEANDVPNADSGSLKAACILLSIAGVITRHRMDGTMPAGISVGGISLSDNPDAAIERLRNDAYKILYGVVKKARTYRRIMRVARGC